LIHKATMQERAKLFADMPATAKRLMVAHYKVALDMNLKKDLTLARLAYLDTTTTNQAEALDTLVREDLGCGVLQLINEVATAISPLLEVVDKEVEGLLARLRTKLPTAQRSQVDARQGYEAFLRDLQSI